MRWAWRISAGELEKGVETMLSVLDPDLSELEGAKDEEAFGRFLIDGALLVIGADDVVEPGEVTWLKSVTEGEWSGEQIAQHLSDPAVRDALIVFLRWVGPSFGPFGLGMALYFACQGAGRMRWLRCSAGTSPLLWGMRGKSPPTAKPEPWFRWPHFLPSASMEFTKTRPQPGNPA